MIASMLSHALHASFADTANQRASDRRVLRLKAQVATPQGEGGIQVRNLSRSGLLLDGLTGVAAGSEIEVELPSGTRHRAQVMWADETLFGCRFTSALTQAQLSAALLRSDPEVPTPACVAPSQSEALELLRQHWGDESDEAPEDLPLPRRERKLPLGTRLWVIGGLGLAGWAVPAAAAWMFW